MVRCVCVWPCGAFARVGPSRELRGSVCVRVVSVCVYLYVCAVCEPVCVLFWEGEGEHNQNCQGEQQ